MRRCSICGFKNEKFAPHPFKLHVRKEHNRWSYFKYILYLHQKDEDTFTGLEQYVWNLIKSTNVREQILWFPVGKALSLNGQEADVGGEEEEEEEDGEDE